MTTPHGQYEKTRNVNLNTTKTTDNLISIGYYTILYYTILYYTILYYTILYYTILDSVSHQMKGQGCDRFTCTNHYIKMSCDLK